MGFGIPQRTYSYIHGKKFSYATPNFIQKENLNLAKYFLVYV